MAINAIELVSKKAIPLVAVGTAGAATATLDLIVNGIIHLVHFNIESGQAAGIVVSLKDDRANGKTIATKTGVGHATRYPRFQADDGAGGLIAGVYVPHVVGGGILTLRATSADPGLVGYVWIETEGPISLYK